MGISPDHKIPDGSANTGGSTAAGLAAFSTKTEEQWRESSTRSPFKDSFNPIGAIFQGLLMALQGVATGIFGFLDDIAGLFELRWDQVDSHDYAIGDLQDKTQQLEGVIGYGCRYMSSSPGVNTSPATMPFDTQVGPVVGCELMSGGKTKLLSKGLWRFEAQVVFKWAKFAPPGCFMDIVIRKPDGSEFTRLKAKAASDEEVTVTNVMPVVVPSAGYTAEVQAWTSGIPILGGSWRSIGGGFTTTRFSCFKISDETS